MPFQGIEDFVAAVTGRDALQAQGYSAGIDRLTKQRSQQALLDKRLEDAVLAKDINRSRGSAIDQIGQENPMLAAIAGANSGFGSNYLAGTRAEGVGQENAARAQAQAVLDAYITSGQEIPADLMNALSQIYSGGKFGPSNVQVQEQAGADLARTQAQTALDEAKLDEKFPLDLEAVQALIATRKARTKQINDPATAKRINIENLTKEQLKALDFTEPDKTTPGAIFGDLWPNTVEGEPYDLVDEFNTWRIENVAKDRSLEDSAIALKTFLDQLNTKEGATVSGQSAAPASITAPVIPAQVAPEDADAFIQYANKLISEGADPEAVKQRLKDMGISVQ